MAPQFAVAMARLWSRPLSLPVMVLLLESVTSLILGAIYAIGSFISTDFFVVQWHQATFTALAGAGFLSTALAALHLVRTLATCLVCEISDRASPPMRTCDA